MQTRSLWSEDDLYIEADAFGTGTPGDLVFRTAGVERARIKNDGTGTGWQDVIGGSLPVFAVDHGASASKSASFNRGAIQEAFDTAKVSKVPVSLMMKTPGTLQVDAAIICSRRGQIIDGGNPWYSVIQQVTAGAHLFEIDDDTDPDTPQGTTSNQHVIFRHLRMLGAGIGVATGYGVYGGSDGDWFEMDRCTVDGFERGVDLNGWSQSIFHNCVLHFCNYGAYFDDTDSVNNTIHFYNSGVAQNGVMGAMFNQGGGCTIVSGDWRGNPLAFQVGKGSAPCQVTLIGGNFEAASGGTEYIQVHSGGRLVSLGTQFQQGGTPVDAVNVNGGSVVLVEPIFGVSAGKVLVRKTNSTDIVQVFGVPTNLSNTYTTIADPSTSYPYAGFVQRADNAVPSASSLVRGLTLQKMVRDSVSDIDELFFFGKDRSTGSDAYQQWVLTGTLEGSGSPNGVVAARVGVVYRRTDGGAGTTFYVKESGTGNTGWVGYGATGPAGPAGSRLDVANAGMGHLDMNYPIGNISASTAPVAGTIYGVPVGLFTGDVVTYLEVAVVTVGTSTAPTLIRLGLADSTGTIVAVSDDVHASALWTTAGIAQVPLASGATYTVLASGGFTVVFLQVGSWGGTQMTLGRTASLVANAISGKIGSKLPPFATYGAGKTDLPAVSGSLGTAGQTTLTYWGGIA